MHKQLGKDAILNSLSKSYLTFVSHYRMTKPMVFYHGLLGLLQTYEKDHQLNKGTVNIVGGTSAGHSSFKKGKRRMQKKTDARVSKPISLRKL